MTEGRPLLPSRDCQLPARGARSRGGAMPDTTIDGVKIHYDEAGQGEPLLLIMGYGMPGDAWLGSLPFLNGFRSIYYDNRGTGRSDKPAGPYTIVQMADDAAGLLDHLSRHRQNART